MDDSDILFSIKNWRTHPDPVLSLLCNALLSRDLLKLRLQSEPITIEELAERHYPIDDRFAYSEDLILDIKRRRELIKKEIK